MKCFVLATNRNVNNLMRDDQNQNLKVLGQSSEFMTRLGEKSGNSPAAAGFINSLCTNTLTLIFPARTKTHQELIIRNFEFNKLLFKFCRDSVALRSHDPEDVETKTTFKIIFKIT